MPRGRRHYRLTLADALSAHERALKFGGRAGIPNPSLVESALGRPYNGYYRQIERKAAALVESMATNHGFADGNKRTTLILLHTMLSRSGYSLTALVDDQPLDDIIVAVVRRQIAFKGLAAWFKLRIRPTRQELRKILRTPARQHRKISRRGQKR